MILATNARGRRTGWPVVFAAAALALLLGGADARADAEKENHDVPLVGALADRAEVEARFKSGVEAYDRGDFASAARIASRWGLSFRT